MTEPVLAWHFAGDKLRNGRPVPPDGTTLYFYGDLEICKAGLHAAVLAIDALTYAQGSTCSRVQCAGEMRRAWNKLCCRERTSLWKIDASNALRRFAQRCALDVIHMWNAPDTARKYLASGDEMVRDAARAAIRTIVLAMPIVTAQDSMSSAVRSAMWAASLCSDWGAARQAVSHACDAWEAMGDITVRDKYNIELEQMLLAAHAQGGSSMAGHAA